MNFITIVETIHIEYETIIHYCQVDENEIELGKLMKVIDQSERGNELNGDVSTFYCCSTMISEAAVDEHTKLDYGSFPRMFQKHKGIFKCPTFGPLSDSLEAARALDDFFYVCKLGKYFHSNT